MGFEVFTNPSYVAKTGFTQSQFKKLDDLYCRSASAKILTYRTVECDFDEGVASYTYYKTHGESPYLQFVIRKVGPRDMMYEVFKQGEGRIAKSGVFDKAFETLRTEIMSLHEA
jgi:hypothetical protein